MLNPQEYFNKIINWKKYNLLIDILTRYEDKGHRFYLSIMVGDPDVDSMGNNTIYEYGTTEGGDWYIDRMKDKIYIEQYGKHGLFFVVFTNAYLLNTMVIDINNTGKFEACYNYKEKYVICK